MDRSARRECISTVAIVLALGACDTERLPVLRDQAVEHSPLTDSRARDLQAVGACPSTIPKAQSSCARDGLVCEYGDEPRDLCRAQAMCQQGVWLTTIPVCPPLPDVTCPATLAQASLQVCTPQDAYCDYDGLFCHCTNCIEHPLPHCEGDAIWRCDAPPADPSCPAARPPLGANCSVEGQRCAYECGQGGARLCQGGAWYSAMGSPCPISARRAKKEIRYLSTEQLASVAAQTLSFKLATYRYKNPAIAKGQQLGFILDDAGKSFASDRLRQQVNLYGYASMLLATVQTQQRALKRLEAKLAALERRVRRCGQRSRGR